jgi:enamine deaminase RidA (YjgF/YER057c/UK114 family)
VFAVAKRSQVETRLAQLGLQLRPPLPPAGKYVGAKAANGIVYVCGQGPVTIHPDGERHVPRGKVGREFTLEEGYEAARLCALNCLSQLKALIGDLDRVESVLKVVGYINSADGFELQAKVLNGCTELLAAIFGEEAGVPARSAIAVSVEGWIPCETDLIVKLRA